MTGRPYGHPKRQLTDKQCAILHYLIENIEHGPIGSREIAKALGTRDVAMALWSLRFQKIVKFDRVNGNLLVTDVQAP